jgi:hypothetical protein
MSSFLPQTSAPLAVTDADRFPDDLEFARKAVAVIIGRHSAQLTSDQEAQLLAAWWLLSKLMPKRKETTYVQ